MNEYSVQNVPAWSLESKLIQFVVRGVDGLFINPLRGLLIGNQETIANVLLVVV